MHAALGHEHALDRVHVGDDRVQGQRLVGGQAGVHRLEAEDALQALVVEVRPHDAWPACGSRRAGAAGSAGPSGRARSSTESKLRVDEVGHLDAVQLGEPVAERAEGGRILPTGHLGDLLGHRAPGRARPAARCRRRSTARYIGSTALIVQKSAMSAPTAAKASASSPGMVSTVGPVSRRVPAGLDAAGPSTGSRLTLHDGHVVAPPDQVRRGGQAAQPGADHDDLHPQRSRQAT